MRKNSGKFLNGVFVPQRPNRTMYAMFRGSEAPVDFVIFEIRKYQNKNSTRMFNLLKQNDTFYSSQSKNVLIPNQMKREVFGF